MIILYNEKDYFLIQEKVTHFLIHIIITRNFSYPPYIYDVKVIKI